MQMKFKELKKSLTVKVEPIYLVCGEDAFFVERSLKLICDACLKMPEMNFTRFENTIVKDNYDKLNSALYSFPFMSEKRVVLIKEFYPSPAEVATFKPYFDSPCESTVLVICNVSKSDQLKKLNNVTFVDCSKGDEALVNAWIKNEIKVAGLTVTDGAVRKINAYCLSDMTRINGEIAKLIAYKGEGQIDETDVDSLCVKETDYRLYEMVEFIAAKNYDKAYAAFTDMLDLSSDGQKLFISLYYYFRRLLYVSVSNATESEIADALKVKEFAVTMAKRQARAFSAKRLKTVVDKLAELDYAFKSGKTEQNTAVWNGVYEVLLRT